MRASGKNRERGSLVLVALCFSAVIGIALASYITVCYRSAQLSSREYHSKHARYLAEVGLEEALWALNNATWTTSGPTSSQSWTGTTTKTLTMTGYSLGSGSTGRVALTITNATGNTPSITSVATITLSSGKIYTKTFTATTQRASAFPNAIASASGTVTFNTGGTVDSFDSSLAYAAPSSWSGHAAVIAGNNVALNNVALKGYVATYGAAPTYSGAATIKAYGAPASPNIDATRLGASAFVPLFAVTTPSPGTWTGTLVNNTTTTLGTNGGATEYWRYTGASYALSTGNLTINGPVKLVVAGTFSISGSSRIRLTAGTTASLEMFVAGNVAVTSTAAFQNRIPSTAAPVPANIALYVTGSGSTVAWNSTARFDGVLYSTHASAGTINIANTGATPGFYGAILSNNAITFSGAAPQIHYDTDLRTATFAAISTPFIISVLSEVATER